MGSGERFRREMELILDSIGWIGTALLLWAYYLVSSAKVSGVSVQYLMLNLLGTIGVGVNVFYKQAWPALGLEIAWGMITLMALLKPKLGK